MNPPTFHFTIDHSQNAEITHFQLITAHLNIAPSQWLVALEWAISLALRLYPRILANSFYAHLKAFPFSHIGIGSTSEYSS